MLEEKAHREKILRPANCVRKYCQIPSNNIVKGLGKSIGRRSFLVAPLQLTKQSRPKTDAITEHEGMRGVDGMVGQRLRP